MQERRITFIGFSYQVLTAAQFGIAGRTVELATDDIGGIKITFRQYTCN